MARKDSPKAVEALEGIYQSGVALLVLGGISNLSWRELRDEIKPDVILGANGTCFMIDDLDYHLVVENMHLAAGRASNGDKRYQRMMEILQAKAKTRLVSFLSWDLLDDQSNAISIKRMGELGDDYDDQMSRFSFRKYGDGFLSGPMFLHPGALTSPRIKFRVGTVGTQLLHLAGILGVREIHTIGMDFCFKDSDRHHGYDYPKYQPDRFRTNKMFTDYKGLPTQWDWLQGARWLQSIEWLFERDGLTWIDHSDGLFKAIGLRCASM